MENVYQSLFWTLFGVNCWVLASLIAFFVFKRNFIMKGDWDDSARNEAMLVSGVFGPIAVIFGIAAFLWCYKVKIEPRYAKTEEKENEEDE